MFPPPVSQSVSGFEPLMVPVQPQLLHPPWYSITSITSTPISIDTAEQARSLQCFLEDKNAEWVVFNTRKKQLHAAAVLQPDNFWACRFANSCSLTETKNISQFSRTTDGTRVGRPSKNFWFYFQTHALTILVPS